MTRKARCKGTKSFLFISFPLSRSLGTRSSLLQDNPRTIDPPGLQITMRYLPVCLFLVTGLTAVNGQYFCNGGTDADPKIRCAQVRHLAGSFSVEVSFSPRQKGQDVYCVSAPFSAPMPVNSLECIDLLTQIQCDATGNTAGDPTRKQGFPTYRECRTTGGRCTVKNRAGNDLYGVSLPCASLGRCYSLGGICANHSVS